MNKSQSYYLITPAYNAENTISKLIESVLKQSIKPLCWIIVDDGSSDTTAEIVHGYQQKHSFIQLEKLTKDAQTHSFGAKVHALNYAISKLDLSQAEFIGILDADIELPDNYFSVLLDRMNNDQSLGIAGGDIRPYYDGAFHHRKQSANWSIAGALQMFKTQCFQDIGAKFLEFPYGGEDAAMEIMARAKGWKIKTFQDLPATHYGRVGGAAGTYLKTRFRRGLSFASLGYHPLFLFLRCVQRITEFPWVIGSIFEFSGFIVGMIRFRPPLIGKEFALFLRKEQINRLFKSDFKQRKLK